MTAEVIAKADQFHLDKNYTGVYDYLKEETQKNPEYLDDVEILWRFARSYFDASEATKDNETKKQLVFKGCDISIKALKTNDTCSQAHKWYAILLSMKGDFVSLKEKIENAFIIKEHALKANELHPKDSTTLHVLGRWCFDVAKIGWMERKLASAIFAQPPESTYEEAIKWFMEAQEAEPDFIRNAVLIGDSYVQLKNQQKANEWYKKASELPAETDLDRQRIQEAKSKIK